MFSAWPQPSQFVLTRVVFQRSLALIYLNAFLIAVNQFPALLGEKGLYPVPLFLKEIRFWDSPSLFFFHYSDSFFLILGWLGVMLSILAISGISEAHGLWVSTALWLMLWVIYLSIVNVGQTFYGFGWETLLLETGFLAIFMGPQNTAPPVLLFWLLRWLLFRIMFGAGMIKIRGDSCWRDLTCLNYHYETQPLPNPLSWYFHHTPEWVHKGEVLFNHFVELIVPIFYFVPGILGGIAGILTILFQTLLILSGNLSWLNYMTIVIAFSCLDDSFWSQLLNFSSSMTLVSGVRDWMIWGVAFLVGILSIRPAMNLFSDQQLMNASFEPLHLVNTYGAFGSVTRERIELIIEGTQDAVITSASLWKEYPFKGKPGDVQRTPIVVSPYHFKLDWQMWFAAMSHYSRHPWILNLISKLLRGDSKTLALLGTNPFPDSPPQWIRVQAYRYQFTDWDDRSRAWWKRTLVDTYLPPLSLKNPSFMELLQRQGWDEKSAEKPTLSQ